MTNQVQDNSTQYVHTSTGIQLNNGEGVLVNYVIVYAVQAMHNSFEIPMQRLATAQEEENTVVSDMTQFSSLMSQLQDLSTSSGATQAQIAPIATQLQTIAHKLFGANWNPDDPSSWSADGSEVIPQAGSDLDKFLQAVNGDTTNPAFVQINSWAKTIFKDAKWQTPDSSNSNTGITESFGEALMNTAASQISIDQANLNAASSAQANAQQALSHAQANLNQVASSITDMNITTLTSGFGMPYQFTSNGALTTQGASDLTSALSMIQPGNPPTLINTSSGTIFPNPGLTGTNLSPAQQIAKYLVAHPSTYTAISSAETAATNAQTALNQANTAYTNAADALQQIAANPAMQQVNADQAALNQANSTFIQDLRNSSFSIPQGGFSGYSSAYQLVDASGNPVPAVTSALSNIASDLVAGQSLSTIAANATSAQQNATGDNLYTQIVTAYLASNPSVYNTLHSDQANITAAQTKLNTDTATANAAQLCKWLNVFSVNYYNKTNNTGDTSRTDYMTNFQNDMNSITGAITNGLSPQNAAKMQADLTQEGSIDQMIQSLIDLIFGTNGMWGMVNNNIKNTA